MKKQSVFRGLLSWGRWLPLVLAGHVYALPPAPVNLPLSNTPLFLGGNLSPNVMFTLDDSGSMHWEVMPDDRIVNSHYFMFPRVASGIYGAGDYSNRSVDFDPTNPTTTLLRSSNNNSIYYDPTVTYEPWSNADGSLMPNAAPSCAPHTPMNTGLGCRNLTADNTQSSIWRRNGFSQTATDTFWPAVYYQYNSGDINLVTSYTQVEIRTTTATYSGRPSRTDCVARPVCTYAEEIQNFANWYTYYRSRILLARAGVGKAFAAQGNNMRVGFAAINKGDTTVDGVSNTPVVIRGVRQFTGTDRTNFFADLYGYALPPANTPLRTALNRVGQYYERTDNSGPWGEFPGVGGGTQHACRQSYNILMTDGYYNDSFSGLGNADGTAGSVITNHSSPPTPATLGYTPGAPYSDGFSNTLADIAMEYWKRDLRTDLDNKVPTNAQDPAFWQHMVTFTAGLGVDGTLPPPPAAPGAWPDPALGNPQKIDDLWHAAVNGHGDFFSAANPNQFANGLTAALSNINARPGSASAVATNTTKLNADGRVFQAKFNNGDWSGQLLAYPIDLSGNIGSLDWDAGALINSHAPSSRVILTKGATDGVEFQYASLSGAQQTELNKNASGTTDGCGLERVAYLRGDAANEATGGTFACGGTTIDKFRARPTSKLGDIVNSGPFYVGEPSAGHSDVDHPGYAAFRDSITGYKNRVPMVYVGANDGSLHGFNACATGTIPACSTTDLVNKGKELIAYVPSMTYRNLSRLSDRNYNSNHRFFVDGSPMVADADIGTALVPKWRSVLVGSMNAGGQGYFALDVTNPSDTAKIAPTFTTSNAASLLLWEFTNADDADMGYSHNLPPIDPFTSQAKQIVKMQNGKWAVVVGNGFNSAAGKAVLYVLFIKDGEDGVWTLGSDYIKLVADAGTGNGLSTPITFDSNGDGLVDTIYAGDLKGNMWKFDVSSSTPTGAFPANWHVAFGGSPLFSPGLTKPITSPAVITPHPYGGQLVLFGTGKYLESGDITSSGTQSLYGVWDNGSAVASAAIVSQVATAVGATVTTTTNPVNYSASAPVVKGWRLDFPTVGERLTGVPALEDGILTVNTINPSTSPCDFGGKGYAYAMDYLTGSMFSYPAFDTNNDGVIDSSDAPSAGVEIGFAAGGVTRIRGTISDKLVFSKADGTLGVIDTAGGSAILRGRINWRELIQ